MRTSIIAAKESRKKAALWQSWGRRAEVNQDREDVHSLPLLL